MLAAFFIIEIPASKQNNLSQDTNYHRTYEKYGHNACLIVGKL